MDDEAAFERYRQLPLWPALERLKRQERRVERSRERAQERAQALVDFLASRWRVTPPPERR